MIKSSESLLLSRFYSRVSNRAKAAGDVTDLSSRLEQSLDRLYVTRIDFVDLNSDSIADVREHGSSLSLSK